MIRIIDTYNVISYINPLKIISVEPSSECILVRLEEDRCIRSCEDAKSFADRCDVWMHSVFGGRR